MTTLQLYINDELVDLSDDSPMALTFQINNLAEVKNQQGNTSNQFKLPLTQLNRRILGFPDEIAFTLDKPYRQYAARIIQDGLEIMPYGFAELNGIDQDTAAITILSGNVDFFDAMNGKLYDLGDSATDVGRLNLMRQYNATNAWTLENVARSQNNTEGWIWPVVDYGKIPADFTGTPQIDVRYLRPGFFLKSAIDLIVGTTGYTIDPDSFLVKDELYPKIIVQFANDSFEHGTDYQNGLSDPLSCQVQTGNNQTFGNGAYDGRIPFSVISYGGGTWDAGDQSYKAPGGVSASVLFTFSATVIGNPRRKTNNETLGIQLFLKKYNVHGDSEELDRAYIDLSDNPQSLGLFSRYDAVNVKLSKDIELIKDDHIYVDYHITSNKIGGEITLLQGATLTITSKRKDVLYGQNVECDRIFPDISMKDLFKDTLQRFGIICQTNNTTRTIKLASFKDIVNNIPIAKNWTDKCLDQGKSISFQLGGYAQTNYMKYKSDDNVLPQTIGQSQINVSDTTLPTAADLFESQFAPTLNRAYIGGSIAQILKVAPDSDDNSFNISTQPRILIDEKIPLRNRAVVFTDGGQTANITVNDFISVPYFDKPGGAYSLTFDYLRKNYYPELEKILTQTKKVVRYFLLTPRDILELDLLIPIYLQQDGAYYYINKIDSWRKGQPTKVELVKLG